MSWASWSEFVAMGGQGAYVWGAFVNGPSVHELPGSVLGLADERRSWLVGYDRLPTSMPFL